MPWGGSFPVLQQNRLDAAVPFQKTHKLRAAVPSMPDNPDSGLHLDGFLCAVMNKYTTVRQNDAR
jgi:hypothetical protein